MVNADTKNNVGQYFSSANSKSVNMSLMQYSSDDYAALLTQPHFDEINSLFDWQAALVKIASMGISFEDMLKYIPSCDGSMMWGSYDYARVIKQPALYQPFLKNFSVVKNPDRNSNEYDEGLISAKYISVPLVQFGTRNWATIGNTDPNYKMTWAMDHQASIGVDHHRITQRAVYKYDADEYLVTMEYSCPALELFNRRTELPLTPNQTNGCGDTYADTTGTTLGNLLDELYSVQNTLYGVDVNTGFGEFNLAEIRNELLVTASFYHDAIIPIMDRLLNFELTNDALATMVENTAYTKMGMYILIRSVSSNSTPAQQSKMLLEAAMKSSADNQDGIDLPASLEIEGYINQLTPSWSALIQTISYPLPA